MSKQKYTSVFTVITTDEDDFVFMIRSTAEVYNRMLNDKGYRLFHTQEVLKFFTLQGLEVEHVVFDKQKSIEANKA